LVIELNALFYGCFNKKVIFIFFLHFCFDLLIKLLFSVSFFQIYAHLFLLLQWQLPFFTLIYIY
jgi:hypothetical protein